MSLDKYRYHIYPDRIYVIQLASGVSVEYRGYELMDLLGLSSYK